MTRLDLGKLLPIGYLCAAAAWLPASPANAQSTVTTVLSANHAAMSYPPHGSLEATYTFTGLGLTGSASRLIDCASGSYVENLSGGPVSIGSGYDGKIPWMKDFSGAFTPEEGGDRVELAVNQAYRYANRWWQPRFGGAAIAYGGHESSDSETTDRLTVVPRDGKPFDAWFDGKTHLLKKISEIQGVMATQTFFSNYSRVAGVMLPRVIVMDLGSGPPSYITLTLQHAVVHPARSLSAFGRPTTLPKDAYIEGGASTTTLPFRLLNNHIYVSVFVNGKGPYTFIVDSGGHFALSPHLAAQINAASEGQALSSGAGEKMSSTGFAHVAEIALGAVHLRNQTAFVIEVYDTPVEGITVDGMVGFELFRRFGVQIDYTRRTLAISNPDRMFLSEAGTPIPFKFYDHLPDVAGSIGDAPAHFDIDTGSRGELDLTAPFVKRFDLHSHYPDAVDAVTGWGVGGAVHSTVIRLPFIMLGSVRVDNLVTGLSDDAHGSYSDSNYDGNIGTGLLKRFLVTFDYAHQRMYLKDVDPAVADAGTFDKSGMWLNATPAGYVVFALDGGGPAAQAGLEQGDVITSIDGRAAEMANLSDARERFRTSATGAVVHMEVIRNTEHKTFGITLRDLIPPIPGR